LREEITLPGPVYYSDALIRKLEAALNASFGARSVHLTQPRKKDFREAIRVTLQEGEQNQRTVAGDGDSSAHCVMEIITKSSSGSGFWFGLSAIFEPTASRKHSLEHVSLLVFQDIFGDLIPFFRAEWMRSAVDDASKHAQPHWHFTQSPARIESIIRAFSTSDRVAVRKFSPEAETGLFAGLPDFGMFHFAMTSLWEECNEPPYLKRQFDSEQFPMWFASLTDYIAEQISYLNSHVPASGVTSLKDFVPSAFDIRS